MNLIEALKSGKPFRNKDFDPNHWFIGAEPYDGYSLYPRIILLAEDVDCNIEDCMTCLHTPRGKPLNATELVRDWEVKKK